MNSLEIIIETLGDALVAEKGRYAIGIESALSLQWYYSLYRNSNHILRSGENLDSDDDPTACQILSSFRQRPAN